MSLSNLDFSFLLNTWWIGGGLCAAEHLPSCSVFLVEDVVVASAAFFG
jgi:hypothetical protein